MRGLVVKSTGSWYKVLPCADDTLFPEGAGQEAFQAALTDCRLRGKYRMAGNKQTNPIAVGDRVHYAMESDGTGLISEVEDRKNYIVRRATKLSKQTHVIAANIDCLCVVATLAFPTTSLGFIDRLLVTAEAYHIPAVLLFNKCDLYTDEMQQWQEALCRIYEAAGYRCLTVSALRGDNVDAVRTLVQGKTVLFSGHSGVGKSALLNALDPALGLRVGAVSDWSLKGKHTTTYAQLYPFAGGFLIDTPGIKEFGMVDFKEEELSHFFPEMREHLHGCYFANCTHTHEPHCAVKEAVNNGIISEERYGSYLNILATVEEERHNR